MAFVCAHEISLRAIFLRQMDLRQLIYLNSARERVYVCDAELPSPANDGIVRNDFEYATHILTIILNELILYA